MFAVCRIRRRLDSRAALTNRCGQCPISFQFADGLEFLIKEIFKQELGVQWNVDLKRDFLMIYPSIVFSKASIPQFVG